MYHSITFGDKNTWDDWHLIPSSRPHIAPPQPKISTVEVPGRNGTVDLTETLTGTPTYEDRSGSFQFIVANDYWDWTVAYSTIMEYLHGQKMRIVLEDDPGFYYEGRFSVNQWASGKTNSSITIDYVIYPYKHSLYDYSSENWEWDTFNFDTDILRYYNDLVVNGQYILEVDSDPEPCSPTITVEPTWTTVDTQSEPKALIDDGWTYWMHSDGAYTRLALSNNDDIPTTKERSVYKTTKSPAEMFEAVTETVAVYGWTYWEQLQGAYVRLSLNAGDELPTGSVLKVNNKTMPTFTLVDKNTETTAQENFYYWTIKNGVYTDLSLSVGAQIIFTESIEVVKTEYDPVMVVSHIYNGVETDHELVPGENSIRKLVLRQGLNKLIFTGEGTVSVKYQGGRF